MRLIDISRPLDDKAAPWPGDTPVSFDFTWKMGPACPVNVGRLVTSTHNATHVDAPLHILADGSPIDRMPLETYIGPATVIEVPMAQALTAEWLATQDLSRPRLLLKTEGFPDRAVFPVTFKTLQTGAAALLAARGIRLIGVDVPSVDLPESKSLENHNALLNAGIQILESLDLSAAPAGPATLIAFPLKIAGGDASPVRAVLMLP